MGVGELYAGKLDSTPIIAGVGGEVFASNKVNYEIANHKHKSTDIFGEVKAGITYGQAKELTLGDLTEEVNFGLERNTYLLKRGKDTDVKLRFYALQRLNATYSQAHNYIGMGIDAEFQRDVYNETTPVVGLTAKFGTPVPFTNDPGCALFANFGVYTKFKGYGGDQNLRIHYRGGNNSWPIFPD